VHGELTRDDQNRSVTGWVKEGVNFSFSIELMNLTTVELGALLWLLLQPKEHYHRLGFAKPLGFGSVSLHVTSLDLHNGESYRARYNSFSPPPADSGQTKSEDAANKCAKSITSIDAGNQNFVAKYIQELERVYGKGKKFKDIAFIAAFEKSLSGFTDGLPTHYPRAQQGDHAGPLPPHLEGLAYEWFVANDRGPKLALPDLATDEGLPILAAPRPRH
jgi:hypothetical protein